MFAAVQDEFAAALLKADRPVPHSVTSHTSHVPEKRFAVYRNNVVISLINALRARFPVAEKIVGVEFFAAMARVFAAVHPPRSPLLMFYGDTFPDFITRFEPASSLPYLPDVAWLELARTRAYHAADAEPINPVRLRHRDERELCNIRATLHPSTTIIRSRHPIVTIWAMNSGEAELEPIDQDNPEDALVIRPRLEVTVRKLPPGGAAFLQALSTGATLRQAAERAEADNSRFDLTANLAGLLESGVMIDFALYDGKKE